MTKTVTLDGDERNIHVNVLAPCLIPTDHIMASSEESHAQIVVGCPSAPARLAHASVAVRHLTLLRSGGLHNGDDWRHPHDCWWQARQRHIDVADYAWPYTSS